MFGVGEMAAAVYRIETDKGELIIASDRDDVEVVVKQGGEVVRVIDTTTDKSITLRSGVYDLELVDSSEGLKLDIEKATLTRGETVLARIERVAKPSPSAPAQRSQASGDSPSAQPNEPNVPSANESAVWPVAELPKEAGYMRWIGLLTSDTVTREPLSRDGRLIALAVDTPPFTVHIPRHGDRDRPSNPRGGACKRARDRLRLLRERQAIPYLLRSSNVNAIHVSALEFGDRPGNRARPDRESGPLAV